MTVFNNTEFINQTVYLDGHSFRKCRFENCTLVFTGNIFGGATDCEYVNIEVLLDGAARNTADFIGSLFRAPGSVGLGAFLLGLTRERVIEIGEEARAHAVQTGSGHDSPATDP